MADTQKHKRPLSPHLQVYRLPYNALMSITGRAVGVGLAGFVSCLLIWFAAVVMNPALYELTLAYLDVSCMPYVFLALAFVVFFYLGNGVRHVLWDMVVGVNEQSGIKSGNFVLVLSVLLTIGLGMALHTEKANALAQDQVDVVGESE